MGKYDKYSWGKAPAAIDGKDIRETVTADVIIVGANLSREWEGNDWSERVRKS